MKLAISQIAWLPDEEVEVANFLKSKMVREVELAPPRIFDDPANPTQREIQNCLSFWASFEITPIAFQALLFGRPDLVLFGDSNKRKEMFEHLATTVVAAGKLGLRAMVFGSPKNRYVPEGFDDKEAWDIAIDFFGRLGQVAEEHGTSFCIEPNPVSYGCNFVTDSLQGLQLVREISSPGFGLHLDLAGMCLAGEDVISSIDNSKDLLRHFHLSAPDLAPVMQNEMPYAVALDHLQSLEYQGTVSIEMRSADRGNLDTVQHSINFISNLN